MTCDHCGHELTACYATDANERMVLRAWWCQACNWTGPAIGRERMIELSGQQAEGQR